MTVIPSMETERLTLRGHALEDLDDCNGLWGDPIVTRYIGGRPSTPEEVWARLLRYVGHWALLGFGYWVVREKASGRFVGEAGLADFKRAIEPRFEAPEAGWVLSPWAHGRGFATEATRGVLAWGEARFGSPRAVCMISPENTPSIRVAEKCGFRRVRVGTYHGADTVFFER